jgi:hypothetical protein
MFVPARQPFTHHRVPDNALEYNSMAHQEVRPPGRTTILRFSAFLSVSSVVFRKIVGAKVDVTLASRARAGINIRRPLWNLGCQAH